VLVSLELIMGLPGDNLKTFKETLDWSYARQPHHIFALPLQILSRTPLEHQVEEFKIEHSGPVGGEEILSNYSFGREEVMVGKAIVNWHRLLQPIVFRLRHLIDVKPPTSSRAGRGTPTTTACTNTSASSTRTSSRPTSSSASCGSSAASSRRPAASAASPTSRRRSAR
jgi:hypothetical protein